MTHEELMRRNKELSLVGIKGMTTDELQNVLNEIQSLKESGKYIREAKDEARKE